MLGGFFASGAPVILEIHPKQEGFPVKRKVYKVFCDDSENHKLELLPTVSAPNDEDEVITIFIDKRTELLEEKWKLVYSRILIEMLYFGVPLVYRNFLAYGLDTGKGTICTIGRTRTDEQAPYPVIVVQAARLSNYLHALAMFSKGVNNIDTNIAYKNFLTSIDLQHQAIISKFQVERIQDIHVVQLEKISQIAFTKLNMSKDSSKIAYALQQELEKRLVNTNT
jgi:hypothetical protein